MTQDLPDDLFRPGTDEGPKQVREERKPPRAPRASVKTVTVASSTVSPRVLAGLLVLAVLLAFAVGRLFLFPAQPRVVTVSPAPAPSVSESASPSTEGFVAYVGPVITVPALTAESSCDERSSDPAFGLIDYDPATIWRCPGDGVGESITFTFSGRRQLVGVRLINGNSEWQGRYLLERRILSLQWEFGDGSYFVQGLAANNRNLQEVRFPPMTATKLTLTVVESTTPGDESANSDVVAISLVEFLSPA